MLAKLHANESGAGVGAQLLSEAWPWLQLVMFCAAETASASSAMMNSTASEEVVKQERMSFRLQLLQTFARNCSFFHNITRRTSTSSSGGTSCWLAAALLLLVCRCTVRRPGHDLHYKGR